MIQVRVHLWSLFGHVKGKKVYVFQPGKARLVELTECRREVKWKLKTLSPKT